jgi:hypothetical protein
LNFIDKVCVFYENILLLFIAATFQTDYLMLHVRKIETKALKLLPGVSLYDLSSLCAIVGAKASSPSRSSIEYVTEK